jgi:alkylated DNA repair dioxygenase AlkB
MINGLQLVETFIDEETELTLVEKLDSERWEVTAGQRPTLQYGRRYDFAIRSLSPAPEVPAWLAPLVERVQITGQFDTAPDQLIVNNYSRDERLAPHIDHVPSFGPVVASISLLSPCVMTFRYGRKDGKALPIVLPRRSLLILRGAARFDWYHEIQPAMADQNAIIGAERDRRISVTFRTINRVMQASI